MALPINKELILENHCPSMSLLYLDDNGRAFRKRILTAMEDYGDKLLHQERNAIQAKMTEMETGYLKQAQCMADALEWIKTYGPCDDRTVKFIDKALQQFKDGKINETLYVCPCCKGDGKETCTNPDHGFIEAMPGDIGRLGCPVCGHDPNHKVKNGGACDTCNGTGKVDMMAFKLFCNETGYDDEPAEWKDGKGKEVENG